MPSVRVTNQKKKPHLYSRDECPGFDRSCSRGSSSGGHVAHNKLGCLIGVRPIRQMWRQDHGLAGTDQIARCTDDLCVRGGDLTHGVAVVWVAKDDGA